MGLKEIELAKKYNAEFGDLYEKWVKSEMSGEKLTEKELERLNELCYADLDVPLTHSNCNGKFTSEEYRLIYNVIKDMQMEFLGRDIIFSMRKEN